MARQGHSLFRYLPSRCLDRFQRRPVSSITKKSWNTNDHFFRFTRGRFLRDETRELFQRHIEFNVDELAQVAAEACGSFRCAKVEKFTDGMYNKSLLFSMEDGTQAVGKVPNPNAGRPHFTTASEVATMDFMRTVLHTPVPRVLSWSSKKDNLVGAEYIIMEKLPGTQLSKLWDQLDIGIRWKVVQSIGKYQKLWTDVSFQQFGSLYYKHDVMSAKSLTYAKEETGEIIDDRFAIGPSTSRQNTDNGRLGIDFDRGPWNTVKEYETATGRREMKCIEEAVQLTKSSIAIYAPGTYVPSKENKLAAVKGYLDIAHHLLPVDKDIQASHIWHDDLHVENVFVNPDDPSEILGFIDWQASELAPLYSHVLEPYVLDYDGPPLDNLLHRPSLEEVQKLFGESDAFVKKKAERLFAQMSLVALYRRLVQKTNPRLFKALQFRETESFDLLLFARNLSLDGEATYLALLEELRDHWSDLPGVQAAGCPPFPIHISAEEATRIKDDGEAAAIAMELMKEVQGRAGRKYFRTQRLGLVDHDHFEEAKSALKRVKQEMIDEYASGAEEEKAWKDAWPFDD